MYKEDRKELYWNDVIIGFLIYKNRNQIDNCSVRYRHIAKKSDMYNNKFFS